MNANQEFKRAYLLMDYERWDDALQACANAASLAPDHWLPDTLRGSILCAQGELPQAVKALKAVADRHPNRAYPRLQLAEALLLSGSYAQARRHLQEAEAAEDVAEYGELLGLMRAAFIDELSR